jgi:hypothetical protein
MAASERSIVDGGYFDNSGGQTLLDIISALQKNKIPASRLFVVLIIPIQKRDASVKQYWTMRLPVGWYSLLSHSAQSLEFAKGAQRSLLMNLTQSARLPCYSLVNGNKVT